MDICDFHSHILPSADHGSSSVEESLKQLNLAKRYGVSRIVATSHFYPHRDSVEAFLNRRDAAYSTLVATMPEGMPEVKLAAEVLLCANLDELPNLCDLCILGTNTLLIELPFNDFGNEYVHAVEGMIDRGYRVILAHAECYDAQNVEIHPALKSVEALEKYIVEYFTEGEIHLSVEDVEHIEKMAVSIKPITDAHYK